MEKKFDNLTVFEFQQRLIAPTAYSNLEVMI